MFPQMPRAVTYLFLLVVLTARVFLSPTLTASVKTDGRCAGELDGNLIPAGVIGEEEPLLRKCLHKAVPKPLGCFLFTFFY